MMRFTLQRLAGTMVLAASACLTSLAGEAPPAAPAAAPAAAQVPDAPPREYVIPKKGIPDAIRKAVENTARPKKDTVRDGYRKPAEVLKEAGIKPGLKVIEFGSFGQYYSTLLSDVVGPKGMVYMFDPPQFDAVYGKASKAFAEAHPNTKYEAVDFNKVELPRNVDVVFSALFYHEILLLGTEMEGFHTKVYKALRPGGYYVIIDHAAKVGDEARVTLPLHRLDPSYIQTSARNAGFRLDNESRLLERRDDDHKWVVGTPGKRDQTDQTFLIFQKPIVPQ